MNIGAVWQASLTAMGGIIGAALIYGLAYYYSGTHQFSAMIGRFFTVNGGKDIYGGITISKLATLPLGLTNNIAPVLKDFTGVKAFFSETWPGLSIDSSSAANVRDFDILGSDPLPDIEGPY